MKGLLSRLVTMMRYKYCTTKTKTMNILKLKYWALSILLNLLTLNAAALILSMIYFLTKNDAIMSIVCLVGGSIIWWMIYELNDYLVKVKFHLAETKKSFQV